MICCFLYTLGIWALVNNAGVFGPSGPAEMMTRDDFMQPLRVNLLGMIEVTRVFLELVRRENGRIVNAVSILGRVAMGPAPYVVSKFACLGYSDMLRSVIIIIIMFIFKCYFSGELIALS